MLLMIRAIIGLRIVADADVQPDHDKLSKSYNMYHNCSTALYLCGQIVFGIFCIWSVLEMRAPVMQSYIRFVLLAGVRLPLPIRSLLTVIDCRKYQVVGVLNRTHTIEKILRRDNRPMKLGKRVERTQQASCSSGHDSHMPGDTPAASR